MPGPRRRRCSGHAFKPPILPIRMAQKKRLPENRQPLPVGTPLRKSQANYIALVVFAAALASALTSTAFTSVAFMDRFASAFMSTKVLSATIFSAARFSSTFMVLSAASLLLQAETARAAPATRIRARIQNSLILCDLERRYRLANRRHLC